MTDVSIPKPVPSPSEPVPSEFDLLCEHCGYSLVGLIDSTRCPECGEEFDPTQLALARIPWLFRKRIGVVRAYISTLLMILFRPRFFALEMCRPVQISVEDARLFRKRTAQIAAVTTFLAIAGFAGFLANNQDHAWAETAVLAVGVLVGMRCFAVLLSDMPTFIWPGARGSTSQELTPLQNYTAAPIVLVCLPAALICAAVFLESMTRAATPLYAHLWQLPLLLAGILGLAIGCWLIWIPVVFMSIATRCSGVRRIALALYVPLHWILSAIFATLPGIIIARVVAAVLQYELGIRVHF